MNTTQRSIQKENEFAELASEYGISAMQIRQRLDNHQPLVDALGDVVEFFKRVPSCDCGDCDEVDERLNKARQAIQAATDDVEPAYEAAEAQRDS